jgi:hypothetical protein
MTVFRASGPTAREPAAELWRSGREGDIRDAMERK